MCRCGGGADHEHLKPDIVFTKSLHSYIVPEQSRSINTKNPELLNTVVLREAFSPIPEKVLVSDVDEQIIIVISFAGTVKVKSISIIGGNDHSAWPAHLRAYVNAPSVDFTNIESIPVAQEWQLVDPDEQVASLDGPVEYSTRAAKFFNVNQLTLFITKNFGGKQTEIGFIGIQGEFSQRRIGAVETSYESKPQLADHKTEAISANFSKTGF